MLIQVSPSLNIFENFTYEFRGNDADIQPGMRVLVPVGNRITTGWVAEKQSEYSGKVKRIIGIIDDLVVFDHSLLPFYRAVSESYFVSLGMVLDYSLPPRWKSQAHLYFHHKGKKEKLIKWPLKELENLSRNEILRFHFPNECQINPSATMHATGTEVFQHRFLMDDDRMNRYRDIIHEISDKQQCVLLVTPDYQTALFYSRMLGEVDWYHSQQKPVQREKIWCRAVTGKCLILVGGLSALMLPIKNLGCVVSDRAGSHLYQKSRYSDFNTNHISRLKAKKSSVPFIEGFNTFTSHAFLNRKQLLVEDHRKDRQLILNVRRLPGRERGVPEQLLELLKMYFQGNKKILLVVHRKKTSLYWFCQSCKKIQACPVCHGFLNVNPGKYTTCSRCDFKAEKLEVCSTCGKKLTELKDISLPVMQDVIKRKLTENEVVTLSADDMDDIDSVIDLVKKRQIVISTTIIINPFFKNIFDAVIYFRPESIFGMNDYNTGEMIFSLISELKELVKEKGVIDIFSVFHFHYSLQLVGNEEKFFQRELKYRSWFSLPPFCNVYTMEIKSKDLRKLGAEMRNINGKYGNILNIKHAYLVSRKKIRGNYQGKIEFHTFPETVIISKILDKERVRIQLLAV